MTLYALLVVTGGMVVASAGRPRLIDTTPGTAPALRWPAVLPLILFAVVGVGTAALGASPWIPGPAAAVTAVIADQVIRHHRDRHTACPDAPVTESCGTASCTAQPGWSIG